jgi:streptogramin lyase
VDVAFSDGDLWVVHVGGRVLRIDAATEAVTGSAAAAPYARALAVGEGGVWVTDAPLAGSGLVWRIDPATVTTSGGTTRLEHGPVGVATGAGAVWVAGGLSGTLIKIDPSSGRVVSSIQVGHAPLDVAYGDGALWVTVGARAAAAI